MFCLSADNRPRIRLFIRIHKNQFAIFIFRHQDHPVAFNASHFPGCKIGNYHHLFTDDRRRFKMQRDSGNDGSFFKSQIHFQFNQFIGLGYFFCL